MLVRIFGVASKAVLVSALLAVGCSSEEPAKAPAPPPAAAPAGGAPAAKSAAAERAASPEGKIDELRQKAPAVREETTSSGERASDTGPCERKEPGWSWKGGVVKDNHCVIGPCSCVQG